jgi:hypothetical protein
VKTSCNAVNRDPTARLIYEFDLNISGNGLNSESSLIFVQWHGSPSGQLLRDAYNCEAKISYEDFKKICCESENEWMKVFLNINPLTPFDYLKAKKISGVKTAQK